MGRASKVVLWLLAAVCVGAVGVAGMSWWALRSSVATLRAPEQVAPEESSAAFAAAAQSSAVEPMGALNVLLLGSDSRTSAGDAGNHVDARADSAMLVHVSADRTWMYALSVPRDLVVDLPTSAAACAAGMPARGRMNEAFTFGGPECSAAAVSKLTGLRIHHVAAVDFAGFAEVVDAFGGMTVCLADPVDDPDAELVLAAGVQQVSGAQALGLARMRKTVGDGSDVGRTARQRWLLSQAVDQASQKLAGSPAGAMSVLGSVTQNVTTDEGLASPSAVAGLVSAVMRASGEVGGGVYPWRADPDNPENTVVEDRAAAVALLGALQADRRPDAQVSAAAASPTPPASSSGASQPAAEPSSGPAPAEGRAAAPYPFCDPAR